MPPNSNRLQETTILTIHPCDEAHLASERRLTCRRFQAWRAAACPHPLPVG